MDESTIATPDVTLRREQAFRFRVRFRDVPSLQLLTDEPAPLGGGSGPKPSALLAAAVGNCLASSLLFCLQKAHLEVDSLEAEVEVLTERNDQGRLRIPTMRVRIAPQVDAATRERMSRCLELFESFCVVTESVRRGIDVQVLVDPRVVEPGRESSSTPGSSARSPADP